MGRGAAGGVLLGEQEEAGQNTLGPGEGAGEAPKEPGRHAPAFGARPGGGDAKRTEKAARAAVRAEGVRPDGHRRLRARCVSSDSYC